MNYNELNNLPTINGVTLTPNMNVEDIGIHEMTPDMVAEVILETMGVIL